MSFFNLTIFINFLSFIFTHALQDRLLTADNQPTSALTRLLEILDIKHDGTLASIVKATQRTLLVTGVEDWQIPENPAYNPELLVPLLTTLGFYDAVVPNKKSYEGAIFLGGNLWSIHHRLACLKRIVEQGIEIKKIIIMTGDHPIDKGRYTQADFFEYDFPGLPLQKNWVRWEKFPETEADMIRLVFEQVELPEKLQQIPRKMIISQIDPISGRRPTTVTNVHDFLNANPPLGDYLVLSNQPYIGYQDSVILTHMPHYIHVETIGDQAYLPYNISQILDRLARWLYQENIRRKLP